MPQYRIPQQAVGLALSAQADAHFKARASQPRERRTSTYGSPSSWPPFCFLVGIGSRFPVRAARYGLVGVAAVLLAVSVVQLLGLPGPPS